MLGYATKRLLWYKQANWREDTPLSSRTREELALYERPDGDASGEEEE